MANSGMPSLSSYGVQELTARPLGNSLLKKLVLAIGESIFYWRALRDLEDGLNEEHPGRIAEWEAMLAEWEADPSKPCRYESKEPELTVSKVKLQLANEEHARMGLSVSQPHTPTTFVMLGLELEEMQRCLLHDVKGKPEATALQLSAFQDRRVAIRKKIVYLRTLQVQYMPGLGSVLNEPALLQDTPDQLAEAVRLFMPSKLNSRDRSQACLPGVADVECRLREASLSDMLEQLRRHLCTRSHVNQWKDKNVHVAKMRNRHCRRAYLALAGAGPWTNVYRELQDDDCRAMNERELTQKEKEERREKIRAGQREVGDTRDGIVVSGVLGDTCRVLSWIWYNAAAHGTDDAAAVLEEVTTRHIAARWTRNAKLRSNTSPELQDGLAAYASSHASMEEHLANKWAMQWQKCKERAAPILEGNMAAAEAAEKKSRMEELVANDLEGLEEEDMAPIEDDY
ncbi:hypothetical protein HWV62_25983 [Athelia sp. TMB]|nr:hypothetical protein HWV62_25983 [Athelia sp. TMB]